MPSRAGFSLAYLPGRLDLSQRQEGWILLDRLADQLCRLGFTLSLKNGSLLLLLGLNHNNLARCTGPTYENKMDAGIRNLHHDRGRCTRRVLSDVLTSASC